MQKMAPRMSTADVLHALRSGARFVPSHEEAISIYLRGHLLREPLPDTAAVISKVEVYDFEPKDLAERYTRLPRTHNRFFFTTVKRQKAGNGFRMSRAAGPGSWVGTEKKDVKNRAGQTIGSHETLKYMYKDKRRKTDWRMDEYRCSGLDDSAVVDAEGRERVFCRLYVPLNSKNPVTLQESLAGDDLPLQPDDTAMAAAAADQHQQEAANVMPVQHQHQQQLPRRQGTANAMTVQHQHQQLRRQVPANAMAVQQQQQLRRQEFANAMAVQQQELLRRQGPANAMAVQQQLRRQEFANAMALQQQQQPRRQEQASPGLSKIMQPQSIKKRPSPGALDLSSRPRQPAVTNTHHVVEPPPPKRMRPTPAPLEVPVPPVRPQCPAPAMPQPQPVAPQQSPRISPRSQPVAPSSRPVAESPTDDMDDDDFVKSLETYVLESPRGEDTGMIQEEAGNDDDKIATLAEPEMASEEGHPIIQEEAGNNDDDDDDDDGIMSWAGGLDAELERLSEPEMASDGGQSMIQEGAGTRLMEAELEEVPAVKEPGGKIQEEGQDHHQQASSLEGFVADERGDDVIAQDAWNDFGDPFDGAGDIDYSLPLSAYDIQF
ncbi:hypothetical protein QYE76_065321 [Lolium multiflorum]|uniref:NAC domain-containing protein n=1 Tax=Lolium multiflorum TaxID=4521 RepID=A0AAD8S9X2_LOLMU|nr:hypothetical protein QYE76_065161 [Lolium multiflorum]KAK1647516.1 hypothetical protein QYE76_065321 [Lolium multiflorum]